MDLLGDFPARDELSDNLWAKVEELSKEAEAHPELKAQLWAWPNPPHPILAAAKQGAVNVLRRAMASRSAQDCHLSEQDLLTPRITGGAIRCPINVAAVLRPPPTTLIRELWFEQVKPWHELRNVVVSGDHPQIELLQLMDDGHTIRPANRSEIMHEIYKVLHPSTLSMLKRAQEEQRELTEEEKLRCGLITSLTPEEIRKRRIEANRGRYEQNKDLESN